jgi:predicted amidophosphoribosyltransferase
MTPRQSPTSTASRLPLCACSSDPGGGYCENCHLPVQTIGGKYHCGNCGHNGPG